MGQVYILGKLGVGSYHFGKAVDQSYISYEGLAVFRLYNIPEKKYFENATYDYYKRKFTGEVNWTIPITPRDTK